MQIRARVRAGIVLSTLALVAAAEDAAPKMKVGLWEVVQRIRIPADVGEIPANIPGLKLPESRYRYCVDSSTNDMGRTFFRDLAQRDPAMRKSAEKCKISGPRKIGGRLILTASCPTEEGIGKATVTITGDFDSTFNEELAMSRDDEPPLTLVTYYKWTGECKPGMKPGEMTPIDAPAAK